MRLVFSGVNQEGLYGPITDPNRGYKFRLRQISDPGSHYASTRVAHQDAFEDVLEQGGINRLSSSFVRRDDKIAP